MNKDREIEILNKQLQIVAKQHYEDATVYDFCGSCDGAMNYDGSLSCDGSEEFCVSFHLKKWRKEAEE